MPRVLLCGRADLLTKPGGDTRQILDLRSRLEPLAGLSLDLEPRLDGYNVVNIFNLSRPIEPAMQAAAARRAGVPVVCTPIFQDLWEYNRHGRQGLGRSLFRGLGSHDDRLEDARALVNLLSSGPSQWFRRPALCLGLLRHCFTGRGLSAVDLQRRLLQYSDVVVFNSSMEAQAVTRSLRPDPGSYEEAVVPVGVDPAEFETPDPAPFEERFGRAETVISVGRVEDLKNQLSLIRAMGEMPQRLVLIGDPNPRHGRYVEAVRAAVARHPNTLLLSGLERPMLLSALAAATVHALPSWFETAGLTSLEAAASGCAVVSTDRGYARAYLGEDALYCDPADPRSIGRAIQEALKRGPSRELRQRVLTRFSVQQSARAMRDVYSGVVA